MSVRTRRAAAVLLAGLEQPCEFGLAQRIERVHSCVAEGEAADGALPRPVRPGTDPAVRGTQLAPCVRPVIRLPDIPFAAPAAIRFSASGWRFLRHGVVSPRAQRVDRLVPRVAIPDERKLLALHRGARHSHRDGGRGPARGVHHERAGFRVPYLVEFANRGEMRQIDSRREIGDAGDRPPCERGVANGARRRGVGHLMRRLLPHVTDIQRDCAVRVPVSLRAANHRRSG